MGDQYWRTNQEHEIANVNPPTFAERVKAAREATLDLYLEDPNPESAHLIQVFEETVQRLIAERKAKQKD